MARINERSGIKHDSHGAAMQTARTIEVAMFGYANDNNGHYPDGTSSTEVFQKLIDGGYINDPSIFYIPLPGKIGALAGQKLKPENVCFDVTADVDTSAPDALPLVFLTGYKITYTPGGGATPLIKPYPPFWTRTWQGWWRGESGAPAHELTAPVPESPWLTKAIRPRSRTPMSLPIRITPYLI